MSSDGEQVHAANVAQVLNLIQQTAAEVAAQEDQLRHLVIDLIEEGRGKDAVGLLNDWNEMAPGEVLSKHKST